MTEYDWTEIRTKAIRAYDETPGRELEAELIQAFEQNPRHIQTILETVAAELQAGASFRSPWAIARSRAQTTPEPIRADDKRERDQAIHNAENWVRHGGLILPLEELLRALFKTADMTPTLAQLEKIEQETRKRPGRPHYDRLLKAQLTMTRKHGPQPIPDSEGDLHAYDTPELRQRITVLWESLQDKAHDLEVEAQKRHETNIRVRQHLKAKPRIPVPDDREPPF
jgi:hypothetical protein